MSYCYNCGEKISVDSTFCPECGTRLNDDIITDTDYIVKSNNQKDSTTYKKKGLILTDSALLAKKISANQNDILTLINTYIAQLKKIDLCYKLVDMSDYTHSNKWYDYQSVLLDIHENEVAASEQESEYLFIIGGNNVIPVPVVNNYIKDHDNDIDTDILYSYPYGRSTQRLLESSELFKAELLYMVSRLPLASDATFDDLSNFLQRSLKCHKQGGIIMTHAYGQSDPHWLVASSRVVNNTYLCGLLPYLNSYSSQVCNGRVLISPPIDNTNLHKFFINDATLYYFNLHGGDQPDTRYYMGQKHPHSKEYKAAFFPEAIAAATCDNIFAAECCYGAKFVGYDKQHSMLHSALMNKTLLFLGSSRVAYGQVDSNNIDSDYAQPFIWADLMCAAFIDGLLCGLCAGEALLYARKMFFEKNNNPYGNRSSQLDLFSAISLAEFNLFGDPMLGVIATSEKSVSSKKIPNSDNQNIADKSIELGFEIEDVTNSNKNSLLQQVRSRVDANIETLTSKIGESLYATYSLSPRKPKQILRVKYSKGESDYCVIYDDKEGDVTKQIVVISNESGDIKTVGMSK